jgi:integrase
MAHLNKLRDITILNAARRPSHYMLGDGGNLYLRVLPGDFAEKRDGKDWWFRYQMGGVTSKLALGSYVDVSTKEAREKAADLRKVVLSGVDPKRKRATDAAERMIASEQPQTVNELFDEWKTAKLVLRKGGGGKEVERMFRKDILPVLGAIPIGSLRRRHIMSVLNAVQLRGAKRVAGLLLGELRLFVKYGVLRELIEGDITSELSVTLWEGQSNTRKRVLSEKEIIELHKRLSEGGMKASTVAAMWIMLSTLCRTGALSKARWDDIDFEATTWTAARKSPDDDDYVIFLSPFALRYFSALKESRDAIIERKQALDKDITLSKYDWVFPAKNPKPDGVPQHIDTKSFSKQIYARQVTTKQMKNRPPAIGQLKLGKARWTAHDLRRTGSTMMSKIGVVPQVRELCLNHVPKDKLQAIYDQNKHAEEMKEAWLRLGEKLEALQQVASANTTVAERTHDTARV